MAYEYGFREVIVDQPFAGKWTEVEMNLGGGHGTFQGTKYSDTAGGFSYKNSKKHVRHVVENRFVFWRVLNDVLELTETSMDYNLEDNQLRIRFPDSPIVGSVTVVETESTLVMLVSTVTSVNRFVFVHPTKIETGKSATGNQLPSIFAQATQRPLMKFGSFSLFEHTINIPVPTTATSCLLPHDGGCMFAMSYENGGVTICKVTKDDSIICYDLRQSNIFAKILSYTPSILRPANNATSVEAVLGLYFFSAKVVHEKTDLFLTTLSMNGHLRLYMCGNLHTIDSWTIVQDVMVDNRFGVAGFTDSSIQLRSFRQHIKDYPSFTVFLPGDGFKVFQCLRDSRGPSTPKLVLNQLHHIGFREKSLIDYCVTSKFLFSLVNNPDEETDWEVKSYDLSMQLMPRFNLALLEPTPQSDVFSEAVEAEPKEFYMNLIFNKWSFSVSTIYSALSMFKNSMSFPKPENDWELTKLFAMRVIDSEIRAVTSESDEPVADDEFRELSLKYWGEFYTSCVEYHVNTVKPFGIFYEHNTKLLCIVKKSRISFLRPTDFLETAFYFPHLISPKNPVVDTEHTANFLKYLEILEMLEATMDQQHNSRIANRIFQEKKNGMTIWGELATLLIDTDPQAEVLERQHFMPMLTAKLHHLGSDGTRTMTSLIRLMSSWDIVNNEAQTSEMDTDQGVSKRVKQYFMASRLGANVAFHILKQLLNMRYIIARNTLLLQAILHGFVSQPDPEVLNMSVSYNDQKIAKSTVFRAFCLLSLCDKPGEFVLENWTENSRKVAALLNCGSTDQLIHGKIPDFWPVKLLEFFSYSSSGGLAIRSRVDLLKNPVGVVAYASAIGKSLWVTEDSIDRPFEEFLISAGQYNALAAYSGHLRYLRKSSIENTVLSSFYKGVTELFLRDPLTALNRFASISPVQLENVPYISKLLGMKGNNDGNHFNAYYEKTISLFQVFGFPYGVQRLTQKALLICRDDRSTRIMSVLGFKNALALGDYESAFDFILGMPKESVGANGQVLPGKEREASLRTFVIRVLEKKDVAVLVELKVEDYMDSNIRSEIEKVLQAQVKLADPLAENSIYQMVYFYYLSRNSFQRAATVLLERIVEVGLKGKGRAALEIQRDCYLDILTCITLIKAEEEDTKEKLGGGSGDGVEVEDWLRTLMKVSIQEPVLSEEEEELRENTKSYEKMYKECELCISLLLLNDDKDVAPIQSEFKREKAKVCIQQLIQLHHYDQAVKLATLWNISYLPIVSALALTCANLLSNPSPDPSDIDCVKHLDTSDLPNANLSASDIAFLVLKKYVTTLEKGKETKLHKEATTVLLRYYISLPRWLLDSYKKRDVNQLILCFMLFGDWEEAAELSIEVLDVGLGRRDGKGYDPTIQTVTPYVQTPIIPYTTIEDLANQINEYLVEQPKLEPVLQALREKCEDFVTRVLETRMDRRMMFAQ